MLHTQHKRPALGQQMGTNLLHCSIMHIVALPMIARNYSQAQEHGAHFTEIMLATAKCEVEKQGGGGKRGEELDAKGYNSMGVVP